MAISRLVIAPNWIGDAVMALPFLRAIRRAHPKDSLAVLASREPAAVFRASGLVDEVIPRRGLLRDAVRVGRARFSEAWLLPNSFRSAVAPFLAAVPVRIGYATDRRGALLTHPIPEPARSSHQLRDYDRLLAARAITPDADPPALEPSPDARQRADAALRAAGIAASRVAILAPSSAASWTKRWPAERYAELSDALQSRGFATALAIGPREEQLASRVRATARRPLPALGADVDPADLAALLARATVAIGNDSGPMHLAAAVGTPVVVFFGPTDPGRTSPTGSRSRVLDRYVFCSPCFRADCPYAHECMREISVEDALKAVEGVLAETVSRQP